MKPPHPPRPGGVERSVSTLTGLQSLRAFAALVVVLIHLQVLMEVLRIPAPLGGVDLFFVISGFIMVFTTMDRDIGSGQFIRNRIIRVVPLYWVLTLFTFAVAASVPGLFKNTTGNVAELVQSLLFVPFAKDGVNVRPVLFVGWTLNYEMFFYLLFAIGMLFRDRLKGIFFTVACLAGIVTAGLVFEPNDVILRFFSDPIILEFAGGMIVAVMVARFSGGDRPSIRKAAGVLTVVLLIVTSYSWMPFPDTHRAMIAGVPAVGVVAAIVIWEKSGGAIASRIAGMLGDASYSLYLIHPFIVAGFVLGARHLGLGWSVSMAAVVACIVCVCIAAVLTHRLVERPLVRWTRGILAPAAERRGPIAPGTA